MGQKQGKGNRIAKWIIAIISGMMIITLILIYIPKCGL
jgi:hypothetical protein